MNTRSSMARTAGCCILLALSTSPVEAEELKDPWTRDDDISSTRVQVDYHQDGSGLWTYEYVVIAPEDNLGEVGSFSIRLRCDAEFDNAEIVPDPVRDDIGFSGRLNRDPVTPTAVRADWGAAFSFGIGQTNSAWWGLLASPGEKLGTLTLVSVAAPGLRQYELRPSMDTLGYDYSDGPDADLPWEDDFAVHGVIPGPGCPGEVPPVEEPRFAGTLRTAETQSRNELLTYKHPLKDRHQLEEGTKAARITIIYDKDLDPKTFKVEPGWARRLFHPEPGGEETVEIPLKRKRVRLFLEGRPDRSDEAANGDGKAPPKHARKDRDEFEFRLPGYDAKNDPTLGKGKARGHDK